MHTMNVFQWTAQGPERTLMHPITQQTVKCVIIDFFSYFPRGDLKHYDLNSNAGNAESIFFFFFLALM